MMLSGLRQDLTLALRQLRSRPGFALLVVLTLGSAAGVNVSLFTVFNYVVYQPWPVRDPARVRHVMPAGSDTREQGPDVGAKEGLSIAEWRSLAAQTKTLGLVAMDNHSRRVALDDRDVRVGFVSASFFDVMGVPMEHGRNFEPHEDGVDEPGTNALVTYRAWKRLFGADPGMVGRTIRLDGMPFTIVGVVGRRFTGTTARREADLWLPLPARARWEVNDRQGPRAYMTDPARCCIWVSGRLAPGFDTAAARSEVQRLSQSFRSAAGLPPVRFDLRGTSRAEAYREEGWRGRGTRGFAARMSLFFLAVLLVLLLACANVGNLLIARGYARQREIAVRLSLGASRARIVRQLLTEAVVLALLAAGVGLAIASFLPEAIVSTIPEGEGLRFTLDVRVVVFALGLCVLSCAAFGLAPALHCTRVSVSGALKDGPSAGQGRLSLRSVLLGAQVAICVVLLVSAGLLTRGVRHALVKELGFDAEGIQIVRFQHPPRKHDAARTAAFGRQLREEVEALAGGDHIAVTASVPLEPGRTSIEIPGRAPLRRRHVGMVVTTPRYFELLGLPIVAGRNFTKTDPPLGVAVVSEELARRYWPGESPLGKQVLVGVPRGTGMEKGSPREIIGVAKDAYVTRAAEIEPTVYVPLIPGMGTSVLVRAKDGALAQAVAALGRRLDPEMRVRVSSVRDPLEREVGLTRLAANVAGSVGVLALALATVGLFGVFAYSVQQRTRELGIRIALGAETVHVVGVVLSTAARALGVGLAVGLLLAAAASRVLENALFGLSPLDPLTYAGVVAILIAAGLAATYLPARRALSVDPTVALRYE